MLERLPHESMRPPYTITILMAVTIAACSGQAADSSSTSTTLSVEETTTTESAVETTAPTTTTTVAPDDPEAVRTVCEGVAIALFDLDAGIRSDLESTISATTDQIDLTLASRAVAFYDEIGDLATGGPADLESDLALLAASVDPWRSALDRSPDEAATLIADTSPDQLVDQAVRDAADRVAIWTASNCEEQATIDPAAVYSTVMLDALTEALAAAGEFGGPELPVAYGDDPALDELHDLCGVGDVDSCDELYLTTISGEYTLWGHTCGGSVLLRPFTERDCGRKLDLAGPVSYGDDPDLDGLWDACAEGDPPACDDLYGLAPLESEYEKHALTCGGNRAFDLRPCLFTDSFEPWTYGDDQELDALWDACSVGDAIACLDLFFDSPFDSVYEALGDHCGALTEVGYTCEEIAAQLDVPVG